jgi:hypothetical protein
VLRRIYSVICGLDPRISLNRSNEMAVSSIVDHGHDDLQYWSLGNDEVGGAAREEGSL